MSRQSPSYLCKPMLAIYTCWHHSASIRYNTPVMHPFFKYYGGKWRDAVKYYQPPDYNKIVEPFAGAAGYSVRYGASRKVVLADIDPFIYGIWHFLIHASPQDIVSIPDIPEGGSVDDLSCCQEAKWLVGFWLNAGSSMPCKTPSAWMRSKVRIGNFWGNRARSVISTQIELIRHWKVYNCSYENIPVKGPATWFIDPPYQKRGKHYRYGSKSINYKSLGEWCRSMPGQVIVCEQEGADWLPFSVIADVRTTHNNRSVEAVWQSGTIPVQGQLPFCTDA